MSEVFGRISAEGEIVELDNNNTQIYTHLGRLAIYNHIFVIINEEDRIGCFIWAEQPPANPNYTLLYQLAMDNECVAFMNIKQVSDADMTQFEASASSDLDGGIPDDWE